MKSFLSVIICTYNRAQSLAKTLDSLLRQEDNGSFNYEVLIIDNNSQDETRKVAESFVPQFQGKGKLRYIFEPKQGKPYALNRGIEESQGDILVFTDDDVIIGPQWIDSILKCFKQFDCDGAGGRVLPLYPKGTPRWIKDNPHKMAGGVVICDLGLETKKFDENMGKLIGANFAFKKSTLRECGNFRTDLYFGKIAVGEDTELIQRLLQKNKILYYCGEATVWHPVDLKRLKFRNAAQWHMSLGRFAAHIEYEQNGKNMTYLWGIPQYLIKGIVVDGLSFVFRSYSRLSFWNNSRSFFRKWGMMAEYRSMKKKL